VVLFIFPELVSVSFETGYYVDMAVEDYLAGVSAVVHADVYTSGFERYFDCFGDFFRRSHHGGYNIFRQIKNVLVMFVWNNQSVSEIHRFYIEESADIFTAIDYSLCRYLPFGYFAKNTVSHA